MHYSNLKLFILNYYESLINQIDIFTEEQLDCGADNQKLNSKNPEYDSCQDENENSNLENQSIVGSSYFVKYDDHSNERHDMNDLSQIMWTDERTLTNCLNLARNEIINEVKILLEETVKCNQENLKKYREVIEDEEKIRELVFGHQFGFILRIDELLIEKKNDQADLIVNPSPFRFYLFILDFYLRPQEIELLK